MPASAWSPEDDAEVRRVDRKSTRLNSSHGYISYAVFCLKKKKKALSSISHLNDGPQPLPCIMWSARTSDLFVALHHVIVQPLSTRDSPRVALPHYLLPCS